MVNEKQNHTSCKISRYQAIFLFKKVVLNYSGAIFVRDLNTIGEWERMTDENFKSILKNKAVQDFIITKIK